MSNNIGELIGSEGNPLLYKEDPLLISNVDGIGIEVEIENCVYDGLRDMPIKPILSRFYHSGSTLPELFPFWRVVKDGSLRRGTEFIFNGPLVGANITKALTLLDEFFKGYVNNQNNRGVITSDRCSVHVHLDVRELTDKQLTNLILIYTLFERFIFLAIDPSRIKNNYCRPLTDSSFKYILNNLLNTSHDDDRLIRILQAISSQCNKYSALNILPLTSKGSIEFRHHQGTTKPLELINWINIIFTLKNISRIFDISELLELYDSTNALNLIEECFKDLVVYDSDIHDHYTISSIINKGANDVKEIIHMGALSKLNDKPRSRVSFNNSLLYKYRVANNINSN